MPPKKKSSRKVNKNSANKVKKKSTHKIKKKSKSKSKSKPKSKSKSSRASSNNLNKKKKFSKKPKSSKRRDFADDQNSTVSQNMIKKLEKAYEETCQQLEAWEEEGKLQKEIMSKKVVTDFKLDPWQQDAVDALVGGANVVVDAPTSAGKTRVVESFIDQNIGEPGFRACYTCPVKSLSNDKLREFREKYGKGSVGIATGDVKENLDAPLVIATLESYRNSLLGVEPDLNRKLVIFDEYHFLQDDSRGSAWEEAIILTPTSCQLLLLSASLSNASDFAQWLEHLFKRPSVLIEVSKRPVPLANMVWHHDNWYLDSKLPIRVLAGKKNPYIEPVPLTEMVPKLLQLRDMKLTPCIVYAGKRLSCELIALQLLKSLSPIDKDKREKIGQIIMQADEEYNAGAFLRPNVRKMIQVYGIAYHHSGLAPMARLLIETLVKEGLLQFCVATMGLSLGINFSVKSTIISDGVRPGEFGFVPYSPSEVLQMKGRAGRRGKDVVGYSCWFNNKFYKKFANTQRDECSSRLRNDPITFLGLMSRNFSLGKIEKFYQKSFQKFNAHKSSSQDLRLIRDKRVSDHLDAESLPCASPASEFSAFQAQNNSICYDCQYQVKCHDYITNRKNSSSIASLHLHLHRINALTQQEKLSPLGEIARYFPQSGGFVIANMILRSEINTQNITKVAELMGAFSLARFKTPQISEQYVLPFNVTTVEKDLEYFYPSSLFPELYDTPRGFRKTSVLLIREFNPMAGYIVKNWIQGWEWKTLLNECSSKNFGAGDITGLLYRTASFLQSLLQSQDGELARAARDAREQILREPLQITI